MMKNAIVKTEDTGKALSVNRRARVILDLSGFELSDQPALLEEKLRRTIGISSVEINVYSKRMNVEFDPSIISLDKIRAMVKRR